MIMILSPFRVNAASNGASLIVDYENENFQEFYSTNIEPRLDLIIERCRSVTNAENVLIGYSKTPFSPYTDDTFVCYNVDFTENIEAYVYDVGTSSADLKLTFPSTKYRIINVSNLSNVSSLSTTSTISAFHATSYNSSLNEFKTNLISSGSIYIMLFYNDKNNIVFTNNEDNKLIVNGRSVDYDFQIPIYNNLEKNKIEINNSCTENCEVTTIYGLVNTPDTNQNYKFVVTDGTNTILEKYYIGKGSFEYELPPIRNDISLSFKLYQYLDNGDLELLEEKEYTVDLKYDSPCIVFIRNQYTDIMLELRIYYYINDFNSEYTYQHKINDNEWITTDGAVILDIEDDSIVQARIIDGTGKVILSKNYNLLIVDPNRPYADYTISEYRGTADFMAYVYNIGDNYYCDYKVNDGRYVDHNVCPVNTLQLDKGFAIYSNIFTENSTFSVRIFDADNNLVYSNTFNIDYDQYVVVPKNYKENINKFFNKYGNVIKEFQDLIQYTYDNLSDYIKTFLVSIWTMLLIVVTVRLIK